MTSNSSSAANGSFSGNESVGSKIMPKNVADDWRDKVMEHGISLDGDDLIQCKFCDDIITGGAYRFFYHLVGPEHDVDASECQCQCHCEDVGDKEGCDLDETVDVIFAPCGCEVDIVPCDCDSVGDEEEYNLDGVENDYVTCDCDDEIVSCETENVGDKEGCDSDGTEDVVFAPCGCVVDIVPCECETAYNKEGCHLDGMENDYEACDYEDEIVACKSKAVDDKEGCHSDETEDVVFAPCGCVVDIVHCECEAAYYKEGCVSVGEKREGKEMVVESTRDVFKRRRGGSWATDNDKIKKTLKEEACQAIARFFYNNAIPLKAVKSDEFKTMCDLVSRHGLGFEPPSFDEIKGKYLTEEIKLTKEALEGHRDEWKITGCTKMVDGWTEKKQARGSVELNLDDNGDNQGLDVDD